MLSAHKLGPKGVEYYVSYAGRGAEGYWLGKAALLTDPWVEISNTRTFFIATTS